MTIKTRDEADIIEDNLRYHRALGVDFFVVADTGSTDGTTDILERYERAGLVRLERLGGGIRDMWQGGEAQITRIAAEMGADWVLHNDADEFWRPLMGNLKDALASVPEGYGMVLAPRADFVARPDGEGPFWDRLTVRERRFRRPPKTAHRSHPRVVMRGPHPIEIWVDRGGSPRQGLVGKPVRRTQAEHMEDNELDLLLAPTFPLAVLHFPFRSASQYRRRVAIAVENRQLKEGAVRRAYETGRLDEVYAKLTLDDEAVEQGIEEGWLAEDTELRDYLSACPDPLEGGSSPPGPRARPQDRRERELAELELDAMYALSRYLQTHAYQAQARRDERRAERAQRRHAERRRRRAEHKRRRRVRRLRRRANRLQKLESSLWWRLRPRLPRPRRRGD
jgi:Glycosyl transferase family 2